MLLGQLYHYLKTLDKIPTPITINNLADVELAGLEKSQLESKFKDLKNISTADLERKVRDIFIQSYKHFLKQNKLTVAYNYWLKLTNPKRSQKEPFKATTEFQEKLLVWQQEDFLLKNIKNVLEAGKLALGEQDVAIFYGLSVIAKLTQVGFAYNNSLGLIPEPEKNTEKKDLKTHPQLLVLTQNYKFPLFSNLNGVCLSVVETYQEKLALEQIQTTLEENPEITLILIDLPNPEKLIKYLQKALPQGILITSLDLEKNSQNIDSNQTFFDQIVKQTLGVRLN